MDRENIKKYTTSVLVISTLGTPLLSLLSQFIISDVTHYELIQAVSAVLFVVSVVTILGCLFGAFALRGGQRLAAIACIPLNMLFASYFIFVATFDLVF